MGSLVKKDVKKVGSVRLFFFLGFFNRKYRGQPVGNVTLFKEQLGSMLPEAGYDCIFMALKGSSRKVLEVVIERLDAQPVGIKDCGVVTRLLQAALEEKDPFGMDFSIEVSSPGPNRPLNTIGDFERFKGHRIKVVLKEAFFGHKVYEGILTDIKDGCISLEKDLLSRDAEDQDLRFLDFPIESIQSACLAPFYEKQKSEVHLSKGNASKSPSRLTKVKER